MLLDGTFAATGELLRSRAPFTATAEATGAVGVAGGCGDVSGATLRAGTNVTDTTSVMVRVGVTCLPCKETTAHISRMTMPITTRGESAGAMPRL
jgi:hypothetical protein